MLKELLMYLMELKRPETVEIDGRKYTTSILVASHEPTIPRIEVQTLTGLVDYIKANKDKVDPQTMLIQVVNPTEVRLLTSVFGPFKQRDLIILAKAEPAPFRFDTFHALENFIIGLHSCFSPSETREAILKLVSSVTESATVNYGDDGISQQVETKQGVALRRTTEVPNPVILAPYRSFMEIDPVPSRFVFRVRSANKEKGIEPSCGLFEADGGAWRLENVQLIKTYLETALPGIAVLA